MKITNLNLHTLVTICTKFGNKWFSGFRGEDFLLTLTLPSNMSPVPEIASPTHVTKHRFFFLRNYTHFSNTGKQIDLCVRWSVAASNQLLSLCYHLNQEINQVNQFMILFIVLGLLSDFPCRTWWIGTFIEIWLYLYCMTNIYLWTFWHITCKTIYPSH